MVVLMINFDPLKNSFRGPTEVKENIPQLTLAKLALWDRHDSVHTRVPRVLGSQVQTTLEVMYFYWNYFVLHYVDLTNTKKWQHCPLCVFTGKARLAIFLSTVAYNYKIHSVSLIIQTAVSSRFKHHVFYRKWTRESTSTLINKLCKVHMHLSLSCFFSIFD